MARHPERIGSSSDVGPLLPSRDPYILPTAPCCWGGAKSWVFVECRGEGDNGAVEGGCVCLRVVRLGIWYDILLVVLWIVKMELRCLQFDLGGVACL